MRGKISEIIRIKRSCYIISQFFKLLVHFSINGTKNTDNSKAKLIWVGYAAKISHFYLNFCRTNRDFRRVFFLIAVTYSGKCAYQLFLGLRDSQESILEEEFLFNLRC